MKYPAGFFWHDAFSGVSKHRIGIRRTLKPGLVKNRGARKRDGAGIDE
jgi:hypothetical protein